MWNLSHGAKRIGIAAVLLLIGFGSASEAQPRPTNTRRPTPTPRRSPTGSTTPATPTSTQTFAVADTHTPTPTEPIDPTEPTPTPPMPTVVENTPTRTASRTATPTSTAVRRTGSPVAFRVAGNFPITNTGSPAAVPSALVTGNFNPGQDSNLDLMVADAATNSVRWAEGNGRGAFHFRVAMPVGSQPAALASADFNGDRIPDVAVANAGDGTVSVLLAIGEGRFSPAVNSSVGGEPRAILALGNVLVIGDAAADRVVVATVAGDGRVTVNGDVAVGRRPMALAAGDVNRDGRVDVVVANRGDDTVMVLHGNGPTTFTRAARLSTGAGPAAVAVGDLDRDGDLDLVVAHADANTAGVWGGDGRGGFGLSSTLSTGVTPSSVAIIDDIVLRAVGEPHPDLFVSNAGSNDVSIFGGRGNLGFILSNRVLAGRLPVAMVVGQFDNDAESNADIAVASSAGSAIGSLRGQGNGSFVAANEYTANRSPAAITGGDFDSDGVADVVVANQLSNDVSFLKGNGRAAFNARGDSLASPAGSSPRRLASGDFDFDGRRDLAVVSSTGVLQLLRGHGNGTFMGPSVLANGGVRDVRVADLNRDGRADLVALPATAAAVGIWTGGANGLNKVQDLAVSGIARAAAFADFDLDLLPDLFIATSTPNTVQVFGGGIPFRAAALVDLPEEPTAVAAVDLDQDGRLDLVVLAASARRLRIFKGTATGYMATAILGTAGSPVQLVAADMNGDPYPDLVVASNVDDILQVFANDGHGNFQDPQAFVIGRGPTDFVAMDFNDNPLLDVVLANGPGESVTILRNITLANPPALTPTPTTGRGTPTQPIPPTLPPTPTRAAGGSGGGRNGSGAAGGCAMQVPDAGMPPAVWGMLAIVGYWRLRRARSRPAAKIDKLLR